MGKLLRSWSYISNPIFIPALVSLWYFSLVSMSDPRVMRNKMYLILILTTAIPLILFMILKVIKAVRSIHLEDTRERILPLILYIFLLILLIKGVFKNELNQPLHYFFVGIVMASLVSLVLAIARYKISLHMIGMGGALGFVVMLHVNLGGSFSYNIILLVLLSGITASSRLYMKAHKGHELWFGMALGLASQLIVGANYTL